MSYDGGLAERIREIMNVVPPSGGIDAYAGPPDGGTTNFFFTEIAPIFEAQFSDGSCGYRPGRGPQQAIAHAVELMREQGLEHVVDLDLSKCFDRPDHDLILDAVKRRITDGSILVLIQMFLQSGVLNAGSWEPTETGRPQGGVISPLLANIYLDDFDQTMKRWGDEVIRCADDILIFKGSRKGAENALKMAAEVLKKELR